MEDEDSGAKPLPKKGLLALIAKPEEKPEEDAAEMAANGIMDAVKAGDTKMLADALRTFLDASR